MALSKQPYRGTRDFFPAQKRVRDYLFKIMNQTAESFGFEPYDGPMLEEVELYKAKSGEELINDQIYGFIDRGERHVAIRPEMTPTVARMVAQTHKESTKPLRWYSIPNLMRYEKPQRGRLREHWQFNCDIFGATGRLGEIEVLQLAVALFENYGANETHFEILINDREAVDAFFKDVLKLEDERAYKLYKIIDRSKKETPEKIHKQLIDLGLDEKQIDLYNQYLKLKSFSDLEHFLSTLGMSDRLKGLSEFIKLSNELGLDKYLSYDPTIVRGLDYYTGVVFEIFDKNPENRRALCGGGAYANLLQIFNEAPLPGVGFGLGDVTLTDFLTTHKLLPNFDLPENDILLTYQEEAGLIPTLNLATRLRKQGLKVVTHPDVVKMKKVFALAEKRGAKTLGLMGGSEIDQASLQIKDLGKKEQQEFKLQDLASITKFIQQAKEANS